MKTFWFGVFFGFGLLSANPILVESFYPMIGVDPQHRFQTNVTAVVNNLNWNFPVAISPFSASLPFRIVDSLVNDFVVFAGESSGQYFLYCLRNDGEIFWRINLPSLVKGFPAIDEDGQQVVVSIGDSLMALSLLSGDRLWANGLMGPGWHPALWRNSVFVPDEGGYLSVYNATDGTLRWRNGPLGNGLFNTTATVDGLRGYVYIGTLGNRACYFDWKVYSFDSLGNQRWVEEYLAFEPGGIRMTMPLISLEVIHHNFWFWGWQCGVYGVDSSGVRWRYGPIGFQTFYSSIAFDESRSWLYLGTSQGLLVLDTLGNFIREFSIGPITYSSPLIDSLGCVLIGTDDGTFYIFDSNGEIIFEYATSDGPLASPTVGLNGDVYIAGESKIYCFSTLPGEKDQIPSGLPKSNSDKIYDLLGRPLKNLNLHPGIYFQDGKKIIIAK